jgi:hypothetical protein
LSFPRKREAGIHPAEGGTAFAGVTDLRLFTAPTRVKVGGNNRGFPGDKRLKESSAGGNPATILFPFLPGSGAFYHGGQYRLSVKNA